MSRTSGEPQPQFAPSLDTATQPVAAFTLTQPVTADGDPDSGTVVTGTATGLLTLHGVSSAVI